MQVNDLSANAQAEIVLDGLRSEPAWPALRRAIIDRAVKVGDGVAFDFRLLLTDPYWAREAGRMMWRVLRAFGPEVLVGPGFGAAPLMFATAAAALDDGVRLDVLMVRDKRKGYHQKRWVEGRRDPAHTRAAFIDDFMEGGSAYPLVKHALVADGHEPVRLVAVGVFFDMWEPLGSRQISTAETPVVALFTRHDIGLTRDCFDAKPPLMKGSYPDFIGEAPLWWRFGLNESTAYPIKCAPLVSDAVYVADDRSRVWRHNLLTGDIDWRCDSLAQPVKGIVQKLQSFEGDPVFGCYDGTLTRLAAGSGDVRWRWRLDSSIHATPEIDAARRRIFINTEQWNDGNPYGHLYCLDADSGRVQWKLRHAWWPPGTPVLAREHDVVLTTCNDRTIAAVAASTGALLWRCGTRGLARGKPAVSGQSVLVATEDGWLQSFHIASGGLRWERRYGRGEMHQFLHVERDLVITIDGRWHVIAFDAASGDIAWMSRLRSAGNWCPVACGRYLVVLSRGGEIAVFDPARGLKVWEGGVGMRCRQPPGIGIHEGAGLLAAAGNSQGLKLFQIHPEYLA